MSITIYGTAHQPERPHVFNSLRGWMIKVLKWAEKRREQRIDRLAFQHLLTLDPGVLADIGYEREDVIRANKLPLEVNAALELHKWRHIRKSASR